MKDNIEKGKTYYYMPEVYELRSERLKEFHGDNFPIKQIADHCCHDLNGPHFWVFEYLKKSDNKMHIRYSQSDAVFATPEEAVQYRIDAAEADIETYRKYK